MLDKKAIDFIHNNFKRGKIVCFTGAGISQESGIPTFRGKDGLWEKYQPEIFATTMGLVSTFITRPERIVDFLNDFYPLVINAKPNPAHLALAQMEGAGILEAIITQNIDGLHQLAGARSVIELHGNAYRIRCLDCLKTISWERERIKEMVELLKIHRQSRIRLLKVLSRYFPKCECGGRFRIDIVLFGERLPEDALNQAYHVLGNCGLLLIIGTSLVIYPAASLPVYAREKGAKILEINNERSEFPADLFIQGKAAQILPQILKML
jgi:NAD-dependent deacetylase